MIVIYLFKFLSLFTCVSFLQTVAIFITFVATSAAGISRTTSGTHSTSSAAVPDAADAGGGTDVSHPFSRLYNQRSSKEKANNSTTGATTTRAQVPEEEYGRTKRREYR